MKRTTLIATAAVALIAVGVGWSQFGGRSDADVDRHQVAIAAIEAGAAMADQWPATEGAMIRDFWGAVGAKDWDRVLMFCPGATRGDFAAFEFMTPEPVKSVGAPEPHPTAPDVKLWPAHVPFPGFPNKTIKMAFFHTEDGRLCVDGRYTIWW